MNEENQNDHEPGVSKDAVEIGVALLLILFGGIVVFDSRRLGASWGSDGPQSGYFPFYIGSIIIFSALATLAQVIYARRKARQQEAATGAVAEPRAQFVAWGPFKQVLAVLIPSAVYVLFVQFIGIYVASAIFIALFMVWLGKYSWIKGIAVGVPVAAILFLMFEMWFKVPLWKGTYNLLGWTGY
jgi:hypothetical protein